MSLNIQTSAVVVTNLAPMGMAEQAGLMIDDIIVAVNQQPFSSVEELRHHIAGTKPGNKISLTLIRSGTTMTLDMVTAELGLN